MSHVQWGHSEARILIDLLNPKKKKMKTPREMKVEL